MSPLSADASRLRRSLSRLKRRSDEVDLGGRLERRARAAAAKLGGPWSPSLRTWQELRRGRRQAPHDYAAAVAELEASGFLSGSFPDNSRNGIRRGCPHCAGVIAWLVTRAGLQAPFCRRCGALEFFLVFEGDRVLGFGGFGDGGLW